MRRGTYHEAARAAFLGQVAPTPWERSMVERQGRIRGLYLAQVRLLLQSPNPVDRQLGEKVKAFVESMPAPDSQRLALARELRAASAQPDRDREKGSKDRRR